MKQFFQYSGIFLLIALIALSISPISRKDYNEAVENAYWGGFIL